MGKQVKGWVPPQEDEVVTEPVAQAWSPPAEDEVIDPVKKKESTSTTSSDSSEPGKPVGTPSARPSEKSTKKSTPTEEKTLFGELKRIVGEYDTPADPKDVAPTPFINAVKRGLNLGEQAIKMGPFSDKPDKEAIKAVADIQNQNKKLPGSESYTKFTQAKSFGEAASMFVKDPVRIIAELAGESLAGMAKYGAPRIAAGAVVGAVTGAPAAGVGAGPGAAGGAIVGMADTSYGLEFTGKFLESLQEAGVDTSDPKSLEKAFQDETILEKARAAANKKAIPIALFDLVSGGLAGKIVSKPAKSILGKVVVGAAETAVQSALGAAGETAGQIASGEKIQPGAILAEAFGEVATSPVEVGLGAIVQAQKQTIDPANPASVDAAAEVIEKTIENGENTNRQGAAVGEQPVPSDTSKPASDIPSTEPVDQRVSETETQKILDESTGVQQQSDTEGLSESSGDTQQTTRSETTQPVTDGSVSSEESEQTMEERASKELDALVEKGAISREGNKITILTEEGGREAKRIYEELNKSKQGRSDIGADNRTEEVRETVSKSSEDEHSGEGTEQQRSESENIEEVKRLYNSQKPLDEVKLISIETLKKWESDMLANESKYQSEFNDAQWIYNVITDELEERLQTYSNDKSTTTPASSGLQPAEPVQQPPSGTPPPTNTDDAQGGSSGSRTYAIAKRIIASDANQAIKKGVKEKGAEYVPKGIDITDKEATDLLELYGNERSESLVRDTKNGITGDTRTALAARLYERYKQTADQATDPETKRINYDKAVDIALTSAEQLKEAGRQANAAKIWKAITSNEDMTVMAIEKENQRQGQKILEPIYKQVKRSQQQLSTEIERLIEKRVQESVEQRLKRAKLFTPEQKNKISSALDALKVKNVKGVANDITRILGAAIWNGSIEAVKAAVLTGADLANAIQAGVNYVKQNFKGQWDEQQYRDAISPAVKSMIPDVDAEQIDPNKIDTPKLSGKKKRDFINQVVDAHNSGKLTDTKFDQLYAKQLGAREFTAEERGKIRELAKTIAAVEQFEDEVKENFTRDNIAKYKDLLDKAQKANADLQAYAQKPSNIWDTLISIMQGNLLTPLSLVTNVYSNAALQPLRFLSTGLGSVVDYSVSKIAKTGLLGQAYRDTTIDLAELQKGYFQGAWSGFVEGVKQLKSGPMANERSLRELNNQFSPVRAVSRWADGNRSAAQKANDFVEGTLGWPAEVFFRLLNLGDKPYRRAAENARAMEIMSKKGLKGVDAEKFMMFPDEESAELIKKAGDDATFQQENASAKFVQEWLSKAINFIGKTPIIGGPLKVIAKSQIPYVKTPWNIMVETLKYAAYPITGLVGIHQVVKGNKRAGSVLIGQAIVGAMIFAVAKELFSKGLLSWDEPYDKEAGKQRERRQIQYDNIPPNSLNVSAIQRGLLGEGWDINDKDTWIDYGKLGVVGLLFDNYSNNYFTNLKEEGQTPEETVFYEDMMTTAPRVMSQSLDQSFLKGTNALLTALQDGGGYETEQWLINTTGALAAIAYPNTLSTISKSSDEFIRDTRDDEFVEKLKNTYKTKFFIGEQLPPKVNLWGEKITGNPEGRDKYAYYLWDPTKFKNVDTDNFKYKLYQSWKESKFDDDFLPSIPKREITHRKVKIKLSPDQYSKLAMYIGEQRKNLASTYINSAGFENKDKEKVIKRLKDLYQEGAERGKKRFLMDMGWNVLTPDKLAKLSQ